MRLWQCLTLVGIVAVVLVSIFLPEIHPNRYQVRCYSGGTIVLDRILLNAHMSSEGNVFGYDEHGSPVDAFGTCTLERLPNGS